MGLVRRPQLVTDRVPAVDEPSMRSTMRVEPEGSKTLSAVSSGGRLRTVLLVLLVALIGAFGSYWLAQKLEIGVKKQQPQPRVLPK